MIHEITAVLKLTKDPKFLLPALALIGFSLVKANWRKIFSQKKSEQRKLRTEKNQKSVSLHKAQQQDNHKQQIKRLAALRVEAAHAEAEIVYGKLFGEIGLATQKLFALAKEEEKREDYRIILEEEIRLPIKEAFRIFQINFTDGGITLPIRRTEPDAELIEQLEKLSTYGLYDAIKECESQIKLAKIYDIPKEAMNRAANSLRILAETPTADLDWLKVKELAAEIEKAFIESGIYPLFQRNKRILERPDLCAQFIEVKGSELIWPGLFIEINGKLQMYGNFQGTCHRGEWG